MKNSLKSEKLAVYFFKLIKIFKKCLYIISTYENSYKIKINYIILYKI